MSKEPSCGASPSNDGLGAGAEARTYLASHMLPPDGGPRFRVARGGLYVEDEDFIFDALLRIDGDFGGNAERLAYAQWVADTLNAAAEKLPREPRAPNVGAKAPT